MRKYQSIWHKIKLDGTCTVSAQPALHKRIKKAVCKEKYNDTAYKIQWDMAGASEQPELSITYDVDNRNLIIFTLVKPILLGDL